YYSHYDFELFSNFTFFLKDEENGDQIRQFEDRNIYGLNTTFFKNLALASGNLEIQLGGGFRYDDVNDNELAHTVNRRTTIEQLALGDVDETNIDLFANVEFEIGRWMINPGLRLDAFKFDYVDRLKPEYTSLSETKSFLSPKLNIIYNPNRNWQLYLKSGRGFHSNDTRVVVAREGEDILPAAYGMDMGSVWKPVPDLWINLAAWYLYLEQEFVYVGDAGIVEPSGRTERYGIDAGIRYQLVSGLYFDSDLTWTRARSIEGEEGENYIPLAPEWTAAGGMSWKSENGLNAGLRYRFLGDRPANEDYSIVAFGYFILDANAGYTFGNGLTIGFSAENLLNTEWEEAQFATESRLLTEDEPVEEIHFTPGTPFFIRGLLRYSF
ncbi:MAG: TonB-dependent receptor, partial [Saprospiraceae bacterium]|nr:TonB-dependent receptor [Saprospiraceae bacterium]